MLSVVIEHCNTTRFLLLKECYFPANSGTSFFPTPFASVFFPSLSFFFFFFWGGAHVLKIPCFFPTLLPRKLKNSVAVGSTLNACPVISLICVRQNVLKFVIAKSTSAEER